jgi:hypothetical protein
MKLKNITITEMYADDDKIFRNKRTGLVVGKKVRFPFDYFKLGFGASEPATDHPDNYEEIDEYEGWENVLEGNLSRLKGDIEKMNQNKKEINTLGLSGVEALEVKELFPVWGKDIMEGDMIAKGTRFNYNGGLYEVVQDHTILAHYEPSVNTLNLYRIVTEQEGTKEDPIPYSMGMMANKGMYYSDNEVLYLCIEDYDGSTGHLPSYLPRYFEVVKEEVEENTSGDGTIDNPIVWNGSGLLLNGKYYQDGEVTYLCNRDSGNEVTYPLSALVGLYVEAV